MQAIRMDVAAGAEPLTLTRDDHGADIATQRELAEEVSQIGIGVKGQWIELVRPVQG